MEKEAETTKASVVIAVDEQYMSAKMSIRLDKGGLAPSADDVKKALKESQVFYNVNWELINKHLDGNLSANNVLIAQGDAVTDGTNGSITYSFPTVCEYKPKVDEETGIVDFRELGRIKNIKKGEIIAEIKYATKGNPGKDVRGTPITPYPGKEAKFTVGTGTILSADKSKIYSAVDGNIRWERDRFVVDEVVNIRGDVDVSVGNLDFVGDIKISGGIAEGFTVKGRNITVSQNCSGANIIAMGDVELKSGAIFTTIDADGSVRVSFAESSKILAGGDVISKSLVNCNTFCKGEITVSGGKGVIIGGESTCYGNISAMQVGSDSYPKTIINLGDTTDLMKTHAQNVEEFKKQKENFNKLAKLYEQLMTIKKVQPLTQDQQKICSQALRYTLSEKPKVLAMEAKLDAEKNTIEHAKLLELMVKGKIYPGVVIKIFTSLYDVSSENGNCTFYRNEDGEVAYRTGTK